MELSNKLAAMGGMARRTSLAMISPDFESIIKGVGEAKSKSEEDALVQRMIDKCKRQIRDGINTASKTGDSRALKDLVVYLVYIDMLGHDASWAAAAVIQLCSHKNLVVKKAAYLATSLLIDPNSDLTIMVTATIQADLRSDNFLIVCTALQAIARCTGPDLVSVFFPQVVALLRHENNLVKKKALLALHRLVQLDRGISSDVEHHLVEKLGHKEPSVMVSALCGLHELASVDPAPYRNLVHYFTNILKQASEGKLGRAWDYHRAPAPFVQIKLLRLLALLCANDPPSSSHVHAILTDVWRRADALASSAGNALVYECMRTATAIVSSDQLLSMALDGVARFLKSKDNNLRYAGIDVLSRLVAGDAGRVQQHQVAIVECLRSPDITLKRKTLDLLFKMAGPENVEVVAEEALAYVKDSEDDDAPRKTAAEQLMDVAERFAPSLQWFADVSLALLDAAGGAAPSSAIDALLRVLSEGSQGHDPDGDGELRRNVAQQCFSLLDRPKLAPTLLRAACWVLGEFGLRSGKSFEAVVEQLAAVPETQATSPEILAAVATALGKLGLAAGKDLPTDAAMALRTLACSSSLQVAQAAVEATALLQSPPSTQHAARSLHGASSADEIDAALPFLQDFIRHAADAGAPPYLSLEDRVAMGVTRDPHTLFPAVGGGASAASANQGAGLRFEAYEAAMPPAQHTAISRGTAIEGKVDRTPTTMSSGGGAGGTTGGDVDMLFAGLDLGGGGSSGGGFLPSPPPADARPAAAVSNETISAELKINKSSRKWGPSAAPTSPTPGYSPQSATSDVASRSPHIPSYASQQPGGPYSVSRRESAREESSAPTMSPDQQRLAASLFGGGAGAAARGGVGVKRSEKPKGALSPSTAPQLDLLGEVIDASAAAVSTSAGAAASGGDMLMLGELGVDPMEELPAPGTSSGANAMGSEGLGGFDFFGGQLAGGVRDSGNGRTSSGQADGPAAVGEAAKPHDPFAGLLD